MKSKFYIVSFIIILILISVSVVTICIILEKSKVYKKPPENFDLLNNTTLLNNLNYKIGKNERELINQINYFINLNNIKFHYIIDTPLYLIEFLLPIFYLFPNKLITVKSNKYSSKNSKYLSEKMNLGNYIEEFSQNELKKYINNNQNIIFVSCSGPYNWWNNFKNTITISHGIDEDCVIQDKLKLWEGNKEKMLNVPFSRITNYIIPFNGNDIKTFYNVDDKKQTILFVNTTGTYLGPDILEVPKIRSKIIKQLQKLNEKYNIIIRLHPLSKFKMGNFKIAPKDKFPCFMKFIEIADIIIGPPCGVLCASTIYLKKKIICYSTINNKEKYLKLLGKNIDYVLNEKNCVMVYGDNINLIDSVNKSLELHDKLLNERKKYVNFMFKCVDGYENIRSIINILKFVKNLDFETNIKLSECF